MTGYDGRTFFYDTIGNLTSDGERTYTWKHGRQLATLSDGTTTWSYTYNADGLRTKKTDGTTTYSYVYNGGQLTQMTVGTDTLYFSYDATGRPMTVTHNGTVYHYVLSLQGDVLLILDSNGGTAASYQYDAWGNLVRTYTASSSIVGSLNPLRYRGYVYDTETGLYYLQSRYYNPEIGRFINADAFVSTGQGFVGNNMFAYCLNNPVMYKDQTGSFTIEAIATAAGAAGGAISSAVVLPVVLLVVAVAVLSHPVVQDTIADGVEYISTTVKSWVDEQEETVTTQITTSLAKNPPKKPTTYHLHHIVAQKAQVAGAANWILSQVITGGVNNTLNLIYVKQSVHQRLHTLAYYKLVNYVIYEAYLSAGLDKNKQHYNVVQALLSLRIYIETLNTLAPD